MNTSTSVISHMNSFLPQALSQFVAQLFKFNRNSPQARSFDAAKGLNTGLRTGMKNLDYSANKASAQDGVGHVHLIGSGPGDAELLTVKAYRLLQSVDVVMYDWLVNPDILDMIPAHVERRFVGKKCGEHSMTQVQISELLVCVAKEGKTIARLKGGDPAIFARAAEECDLLTKHQIPFSIVPGITAASGASAYAGIPLTHRDCAQSVRFITGHLKNNTSDLKWQSLVSEHETLVFYMGLVALPMISRSLIKHGMSPDMPVAVVSKGTLPEQQVVISSIDTIAKEIDERGIKAPTIIIVGRVVTLHEKLNWTS